MKHKLCVWLATLLALCLCLSFAGCADVSAENEGGSGTTPPHTHTFAAGWSHDEEKHWHAATCGHDTQRSGEAAHTYENGKCTECQYEHEAHVYGAYDKTESGHSQTCTVCGKVVTDTHHYANGVCEDCEYEHSGHAFGAYDKTEDGHSQTCSVCGKVVTEDHAYENGVCTACQYAHENHAYEKGVCTTCGYAHEEHTYGGGNVCEICGASSLYTRKGSNKLYFGEYPQTKVTKSDLKVSLEWEAGATPTSSNAGKWTDYGYYISGSVQSYMWYIDVEYQGSRYRGVYFTQYRPYRTTDASYGGTIGFQGDNGYKTNTVYWFQYEPIEWRILEQKDGKAFLMANIILDSQQYYHTDSGTRTVDGKTVYPNNYKESDIRAWLTGTFYETAFDEYAQEIIETTTVDNSGASTGWNDNPYVCENTQDKVFLLSYKDILNTSYGFSSSSSTYDTARRLKSTDYAKSQGCMQSTDSSYRGNGRWCLRSPYNRYSTTAYGVYSAGGADADGGSDVRDTSVGVVPALWIKL